MRFMVIFPASQETEAGVMPSEHELRAMLRFSEELVQAGMMLGSEGLHPTAKGARILYADGATTVANGPFTDSNLIAGFWLIQAGSMADAIAWMRRAPIENGVTLEIRPVLEMDDFGAAMTPELRAQEERLRAQSESGAAR